METLINDFDLESQPPLPAPSFPGGFAQHLTLSPQEIGPSLSKESKANKIASPPGEQTFTSEVDSSRGHAGAVPPGTHIRAKPDATARPQPEDEQGGMSSEYDEPLFEDTPESTFWTEYLKLAEQRDLIMVDGWNKSMDVLLIFAGLFSAIVTAFLVEAYKGLSEDTTAINNTLLRQISASMGNAQPEGSLQLTPFEATRSAVRVNCLWFASLIISLSATIVTVLAKQWIDDYDDYKKYPGSSRERGRIRQSRYANLQQWGVPTIIESLPTLLLIALGLFFTGLVDFLWAVDVTVAATSIAFIAFITIFFIATTVLPAFSPRCAYKAPISSIFLMLKIMAQLYSRYVCSVLRFMVGRWKDAGVAWAMLWTDLRANEDVVAASAALSRFGFLSGWRMVIRQAEQGYVASRVENINARAIAWLVESSTNDVHICAAIRATAGLILDSDQLAVLEGVGLGSIAVSRVNALVQRHGADGLAKLHTDDAMIMIAAARYPAPQGKIRRTGNLSNHQDINIACLYMCAKARDYFRLGGYSASYASLKSIESIFQKYTSTLRKRVLITLFRTLKLPTSEADGHGNSIGGTYFLDPKTIDLTLSLLESSTQAWNRDNIALDDFERAIISLWQSEPSVASQYTLPLEDALPDVRAILYALAAFLTPESSDERCVAACDLILAFDRCRLLPPYSGDDRDFSLLCSMHRSLAEALAFAERPNRVWRSAIETLYTLLSAGIRSDEPDFALACARRISQTPENAGEIVRIGGQPFWNALSHVCQEGTRRQLRNIGQSLLTRELKRYNGGLDYGAAAVDSPFMSAVGNRIRSLHSEIELSDFDESFLLLVFFTDLSARVFVTEGCEEEALAGSGIVSSLVYAWEALTRTCGQAWLDDRAAFWQVAEPAFWEGDTDEARLQSLKGRCEQTGLVGSTLLGRPDADELLRASRIRLPKLVG